MKKIIALMMALMLIASVALVSVSAAEASGGIISPGKIKYYSITVEARGDGEANASTSKVEVGTDGTVTFTAIEKNAKFIKWEFQCEYDVVSGTVENDISYDKVVVLKPKSDIHGIAYFEGASTPDQKDGSKTSPKTGDMTLVFAGILLLALGASVVAFKKIKE